MLASEIDSILAKGQAERQGVASVVPEHAHSLMHQRGCFLCMHSVKGSLTAGLGVVFKLAILEQHCSNLRTACTKVGVFCVNRRNWLSLLCEDSLSTRDNRVWPSVRSTLK